MASVTAFVMVGAPHPYDTSIFADTSIELWEGSIAMWVMRRIKDGKVLRRAHPESPAEIGRSLVDLLASMTPEKRLSEDRVVEMSVIVAPLPGSSINLHLDLLTEVGLYEACILDTIFSRTLSPRAGQWEVCDKRAIAASEAE